MRAPIIGQTITVHNANALTDMKEFTVLSVTTLRDRTLIAELQDVNEIPHTYWICGWNGVGHYIGLPR